MAPRVRKPRPRAPDVSALYHPDGPDGRLYEAIVLLIGDREATLLYQLSARTTALAEHEAVAITLVAIAIRDVDAAIAAIMLISGAVWLADRGSAETGRRRSG